MFKIYENAMGPGRVILFMLISSFAACIHSPEKPADEYDMARYKQSEYIQSIHCRAELLSQYIFKNKSRNYNSDIAFLVNFNRPSGEYRFFIYDLKSKRIMEKGLVAHGSGSDRGGGAPLSFSNVPHSLSTSLGKYKIGYSYTGEFGKAYKMHGLEESNSKAFERFIVFHYHQCVPDMPVRNSICLSWGCPTVSPLFFQTASDYIDKSKKAIIMEIFYQ